MINFIKELWNQLLNNLAYRSIEKSNKETNDVVVLMQRIRK